MLKWSLHVPPGLTLLFHAVYLWILYGSENKRRLSNWLVYTRITEMERVYSA
jgi:uncharacterized protein YhhL (DUF1145 family)